MGSDVKSATLFQDDAGHHSEMMSATSVTAINLPEEAGQDR